MSKTLIQSQTHPLPNSVKTMDSIKSLIRVDVLLGNKLIEKPFFALLFNRINY